MTTYFIPSLIALSNTTVKRLSVLPLRLPRRWFSSRSPFSCFLLLLPLHVEAEEEEEEEEEAHTADLFAEQSVTRFKCAAIPLQESVG